MSNDTKLRTDPTKARRVRVVRPAIVGPEATWWECVPDPKVRGRRTTLIRDDRLLLWPLVVE